MPNHRPGLSLAAIAAILCASPALGADVAFPNECWNLVLSRQLLVEGKAGPTGEGARLWNLDRIVQLVNGNLLFEPGDDGDFAASAVPGYQTYRDRHLGWKADAEARKKALRCAWPILDQALTDNREYWKGQAERGQCSRNALPEPILDSARLAVNRGAWSCEQRVANRALTGNQALGSAGAGERGCPREIGSPSERLSAAQIACATTQENLRYLDEIEQERAQRPQGPSEEGASSCATPPGSAAPQAEKLNSFVNGSLPVLPGVDQVVSEDPCVNVKPEYRPQLLAGGTGALAPTEDGVRDSYRCLSGFVVGAENVVKDLFFGHRDYAWTSKISPDNEAASKLFQNQEAAMTFRQQLWPSLVEYLSDQEDMSCYSPQYQAALACNAIGYSATTGAEYAEIWKEVIEKSLAVAWRAVVDPIKWPFAKAGLKRKAVAAMAATALIASQDSQIQVLRDPVLNQAIDAYTAMQFLRDPSARQQARKAWRNAVNQMPDSVCTRLKAALQAVPAGVDMSSLFELSTARSAANCSD